MVEQPAGRGDDDLRAGVAQRALLRAEADAAVDGDGSDRPMPAVDAHALLDLQRELARRLQDEGPHHATAIGPGGIQALQHGQHEGGRLAGAGLGAGHQVAAGQHERDRLRLDGGGIGVVLVRDGAEQFGRQPELIKRQVRKLLTRPSRKNAGPGQGEGVIEVGTGMKPRRGPERQSNTCSTAYTGSARLAAGTIGSRRAHGSGPRPLRWRQCSRTSRCC